MTEATNPVLEADADTHFWLAASYTFIFNCQWLGRASNNQAYRCLKDVIHPKQMENKDTPEAKAAAQRIHDAFEKKIGPFLRKKKEGPLAFRWSKDDWGKIAEIFRHMWPFGADCDKTLKPSDDPNFAEWRRLCPSYLDLVKKVGAC